MICQIEAWRWHPSGATACELEWLVHNASLLETSPYDFFLGLLVEGSFSCFHCFTKRSCEWCSRVVFPCYRVQRHGSPPIEQFLGFLSQSMCPQDMIGFLSPGDGALFEEGCTAAEGVCLFEGCRNRLFLNRIPQRLLGRLDKGQCA